MISTKLKIVLRSYKISDVVMSSVSVLTFFYIRVSQARFPRSKFPCQLIRLFFAQKYKKKYFFFGEEKFILVAMSL